MNSDRLVSVVIPVFNAEDYLAVALSSIQNQTHRNLEIICVDDCSKDASLNILYDFASKDSRFKIYKNKYNLGISQTLNIGFEASTGDVVARMDADDISLPDRIKCQLEFLLRGSFGLIGSTVIYITEDGREIGFSKYYSNTQACKGLKWKSTIGHPTWMLYKKVYRDIGGYRDLEPAEDYDFLIRCVLSDVKIGMISTPLLKFRTRSTSGGTALENGLVQRRMFNYVKEINFSQKFINLDIVRNIREYNGVFKKLYKRSQFLYTKAMLAKHSGNFIMFVIFLISSIIISPHQLQFFIRSIIMNISSSKSKNAK
jgi:glycosyltransferase involved in cell wall biosynthesis